MVRRISVVLALSAALIGCSPDPHATKITPSLLEDSAKMQTVSNRLSPADRQKFGTYIMNRAVTNGGFGKPLLRADSKDPATVGEAIALVDAYNARMARVEAVEAERDLKLEALSAELEKLRAPMETSGYAPGPTGAYNAVIARKEAVTAEYQPRIDALR